MAAPRGLKALKARPPSFTRDTPLGVVCEDEETKRLDEEDVVGVEITRS